MSYLYSFTAISAIKSSTAAIIATIFGEYITRVLLHLVGDRESEFQKLSPSDLPRWLVKLNASLALLFVVGIHAFHPWIGPRVQMALTIIKIGLLLSILVIALVQTARGYMPSESRQAFSSFENWMSGSTKDLGRYALALYSGLWAYDGWDQATFVAGEMKNACRSLSLALPLSTVTVTILFLTTVLSYFLLLPPTTVVQTNSVALDFSLKAFGGFGAIFFALLVALSCLGALNGHIYTYCRLTAAAAREGYLPQVFGRLNTRFRTPCNALLLSSTLTFFFVVLGSDFASLVNFSGVCTWFWYGMTVLGLLLLRWKEPQLHRPYRVWIIAPILFVSATTYLLIMPIFSAPWEAFAAFSFTALGCPLYFLTQPDARSSLTSYIPRSWIPFESLPTEESPVELMNRHDR